MASNKTTELDNKTLKFDADVEFNFENVKIKRFFFFLFFCKIQYFRQHSDRHPFTLKIVH